MRVSKFEKFKDWLSIEDAAKRLSVSVGEDISEAEILRLGLDSHLMLSVYFVNPVTGVLLDIELLGKDHVENDQSQGSKTTGEQQASLDRDADETRASTDQLQANWFSDLVGVVFDDGRRNLQTLEGVWDLLMLGDEVLDVKREYQRLTGGIDVNQMCIGGRFVKKHGNPEIFEVFRKDSEENYYLPATSLLADGMLVVRTAVLQEFEERMRCSEQSPEGEKPSNLLAVAVLLELLKEDSRRRYTQDSIAEEINARYPDWAGCSKSNLTKLFAKANATAKDENKEARAKADARQASDRRVSERKAATV